VILIAQLRLKKCNIFSLAPTTINSCGLIDVVCFDKTGTLTEVGLGFKCVRAVTINERQAYFAPELKDVESNAEIVKAIASCHSLTR
jgi:cation-transporting ATPase 13A3/4/5